MKTVLVMPSNSPVRGMEPYSNIECADIRFILSDKLDDAWIDDDSYEAYLRREEAKMVDGVFMRFPVDPLQLRFIQEFQEEGGVVAVDIDDDLNHLPYTNPVFGFSDPALRIYNESLKLAKHVHVSTPELGNKKSTLFLNGIDLKKYKVSRRDELREKHGIHGTVVFWQGTTTHLDSLLLIKPAIEKLLEEGVTVVLMSKEEWLMSIFKPHKNLKIIGWVDFKEHHHYISMADINLAPLPDNRFNRAKSELRVLEAGAWGIPSICSDVSPYRRFHQFSDGGSVIVEKERTKNWLRAIHDLIDNPILYKKVSEKAKRCVEEKYSLEIINKKRVEWWLNVLSKKGANGN